MGHHRSTCPSNRDAGNKDFQNAASPRIKGSSDNNEEQKEALDPRIEDFIATRIVNDPTEFSQPQIQTESYCEANERSCCYDSIRTLDSIIHQSRCITRQRQVQRNVRWDQKCQESPSGVSSGQKNCGERRFRDISGKEKGEANPGEFPWMCLVLNQDNDFIGTCAVIPNNRLNNVRGGTDRVITAAHKLKKIKKNDLVKVRVIEYDASGFQPGSENRRHKEFTVTEFKIHHDYDPVRLSYDLAVLKVDGRIDLTSTDDINAACLPTCNNMFDYQFNNGSGVRCWVAGWGKDGVTGNFQIVQNKVDIPIMNRFECERKMKVALGRQGGRNFRLSQSEICAGGEQGKDACDGDGGAPLVCQSKNNRWHVVGLVTWGVDCAKKGVPGIYANVYHMLNFIMSA